jgi:hypothetical protein
LRRVDRSLPGGQKAEIIVELRTIARNLLGLGRLGIARRRPQKLDLGLGCSKPGLQSVREICDVGALTFQGVAQRIELRITQSWLMELALDAIELALPNAIVACTSTPTSLLARLMISVVSNCGRAGAAAGRAAPMGSPPPADSG